MSVFVLGSFLKENTCFKGFTDLGASMLLVPQCSFTVYWFSGALKSASRYFSTKTTCLLRRRVIATRKVFNAPTRQGCRQQSVQLVQNFAARLLSGKMKYEHITLTLKELTLLPVSDAFRFRDAVKMFKCMKNQAPTYLKNMFQKGSQIHDYNTRNINNLNLAKCRAALAQNSFYYRGAALWNLLPPDIRNLSNLNTFKHSLRSYLRSSRLN